MPIRLRVTFKRHEDLGRKLSPCGVEIARDDVDLIYNDDLAQADVVLNAEQETELYRAAVDALGRQRRKKFLLG